MPETFLPLVSGTRLSTRSPASMPPDDPITVLVADDHPAVRAGIAALVKKAGVTSATVASCITDGTYAAWVTAATNRATTSPLANTKTGRLTAAPLALVDGTRYTGKVSDATAFETFTEGIAVPIEEAAQAAGGGSSGG